tara:strand:- start:11744 stop:14584 length:2841 start_codon:yes stop_codon:yes gene_type:complete
MPKTTVAEINALAELERYNVAFEPAGDSEVRLKCPSHDDGTPSASLNTEKNLWRCHACKSKGDIVSLLALVRGVQRGEMIDELSTRYDLKEVKVIQPDHVERMHAEVWKAGPLLKALRDRGVTDEMIRLARLGFHDGRITVPVYDSRGRIRNIRKYMPGGPADRKVRNTKGFSEPRLYREADLDKHDNIWVCGGEMKALVVGEMLRDSNVGAVSATAGEGTWDHRWTQKFKGKKAWVCMDVDQTGLAAALSIADALSTICEVRIVRLPLDKARHPKGDVNDFVGREGATTADLLRLMSVSEIHERRAMLEGPTEKGLRDCSLRNVGDPTNVGWRLRFPAVVGALDTTPYIVPDEVDTQCKRDQPNCTICPIAALEPDVKGYVRRRVPKTSPAILAMVGAPTKMQREATREALSIPPCKTVEFSAASHHQVWDARLTPRLEIDGQGGDTVHQPAMIVGQKATLNEPYVMQGLVHPHPTHQQATLVLDHADEAEDSLGSFTPSESDMDELAIFRPKRWDDEALEEKLAELHADISGNVTRIFGRADLHLAVDLAYHSPLFLPLDGKRVNGWTQLLIMGDSAQGKSEVRECLMTHYGLGEKVDCKNATVAGLLGGLQQMGNRWFHSWGVIPTHDRRIVWLEEVKGASPEVLGKLTDMRSSGVAEIPKIERARTHARTRLIFISNQRAARPIKSYSFGVEAIHELMGSLEDVRRFDLAIILAAGEVDVDKLRPDQPPPQIATQDACRRLILWGWTLPMENIRWEGDGEEECRRAASRLCDLYTEALPLVDRGTASHKIARLAAALAVRTFSRERGDLLIRLCHIRLVEKLMIRLYDAPAMGYNDYSKAKRALEQLRDSQSLRKFLATTRHSRDLIAGMIYRDDITLIDIQDWTEADRETAQTILSKMVRCHALVRKGRSGYLKTPPFIELLKTMELNPKALSAISDDEEM